MTTTRRTFTLILATLAVAASGCGGSISVSFGDGIKGNGELVTTVFDVEDFDSIDVTSTFEVAVTVGDAPYVEVTTDENLVDELDVRVRDGELRVSLKSGSVRATELSATIRLPQLQALDVSGASSVDVVGAFGPDQSFELSGASEVSVEGSGSMVEIDASGASSLDLRLDNVTTVEIDVAGASDVTLMTADQVQGDVSGASSITVPESASVDVDVSGASSVDRAG